MEKVLTFLLWVWAIEKLIAIGFFVLLIGAFGWATWYDSRRKRW